MNESPYSVLFVSLFLCLGALGGGWAITDKLAGQSDGLEFLKVGASIICMVGTVQILLLYGARTRLLLWVLLIATLGFVLAWFIGALALPLFWMFDWNSGISISLAGFFVMMLAYYLHRGARHFAARWHAGEGREAMRKALDAEACELHVGVFKKLHLSLDSLIPVFLERLNWIILPGLILSMIIGMNFRKVFPVSSAFSWGIPALLICAYSFHIVQVNVLIAREIYRLEKELGIKIRPMSNEEARKRKIALRREKRQKGKT